MILKQPLIRLWAFKGANPLAFNEKLWEIGAWYVVGDVDTVWKKVSGRM